MQIPEMAILKAIVALFFHFCVLNFDSQTIQGKPLRDILVKDHTNRVYCSSVRSFIIMRILEDFFGDVGVEHTPVWQDIAEPLRSDLVLTAGFYSKEQNTQFVFLASTGFWA